MLPTDLRQCVRCDMQLPIEAFGAHRLGRDGLSGACKACEVERQQVRKHNLTSLEKSEIAEAQGGCAICGRTTPSARGWAVDHDRSCCSGDRSCESCRRGVLCGWCNSALGYAGDDSERLRRMADYIECGTRLPPTESESDPKRSPVSLRSDGPNRVPRTRRTRRTDGDGQDVCRSGSFAERARKPQDELAGIVAVGEVIAAGALWATDQRHDVIRSGERDPIPRHVRAAVWYRDRGKCGHCHPEYATDQVLHLDHIRPWSNGGPDTTDNLRLLCEQHNLKRSNFVDFERPKRPATWWCSNCYVLDEHLWEYPSSFVSCPRHGPDGWNPENIRCRVGRAHARAAAADEPAPTWHQRPLLVEEQLTTIAYCAHCNAPGMTGYPL